MSTHPEKVCVSLFTVIVAAAQDCLELPALLLRSWAGVAPVQKRADLSLAELALVCARRVVRRLPRLGPMRVTEQRPVGGLLPTPPTGWALPIDEWEHAIPEQRRRKVARLSATKFAEGFAVRATARRRKGE